MGTLSLNFSESLECELHFDCKDVRSQYRASPFSELESGTGIYLSRMRNPTKTIACAFLGWNMGCFGNFFLVHYC